MARAFDPVVDASDEAVVANDAGENQGKAAPDLRSTFVEMLFALAISQVGIHVADVLGVESPLQAKLPALAHLSVALLLISASWLGWAQSASPGMEERLKHLFSVPFLGLLIDVLLVIIYFIVARTVEIGQLNGRTTLSPPTAHPESFWLCVVFGVYAFWDLVTDVFSANCIPGGRTLARLWKGFRASFVSAFASLLCLGLAYSTLVVAAKRTETYEVLLLDGGLVCIVLLFRVVKASENFLAPLLRVTDCRAFARRRPTLGNEGRWATILAGFYILCLLAAYYVRVW